MRKHAIPETVVVVTEALDGSAADRWRRLLDEASALAPERLVVDLRAVPRIDAAGIVLLLWAHRAMVRAGGRLVLRSPAAQVRRMLALARVDQVLEVEGRVPAG
jgi:anti-anti-sigma factor